MLWMLQSTNCPLRTFKATGSPRKKLVFRPRGIRSSSHSSLNRYSLSTRGNYFCTRIISATREFTSRSLRHHLLSSASHDNPSIYTLSFIVVLAWNLQKWVNISDKSLKSHEKLSQSYPMLLLARPKLKIGDKTGIKVASEKPKPVSDYDFFLQSWTVWYTDKNIWLQELYTEQLKLILVHYLIQNCPPINFCFNIIVII